MNSRVKVLIIDDEPSIRELLAEIISEKYQSLLAPNGTDGIAVAKLKKPKAIILDLLMPGIDGIEVCRRLRSEPETADIRIIMLTAVNDVEQRIAAFSAGADDYVAKPVHPEELLARLDSKIRRVRESPELRTPHNIHFGLNNHYFLDYERHKIKINDRAISLGAIEFRILSSLLNQSGKIVKRQELIDLVWEKEAGTERTLAPHITSLRKKLKSSKVELKTVYGVGYSASIAGTEL